MDVIGTEVVINGIECGGEIQKGKGCDTPLAILKRISLGILRRALSVEWCFL